MARIRSNVAADSRRPASWCSRVMMWNISSTCATDGGHPSRCPVPVAGTYCRGGARPPGAGTGGPSRDRCWDPGSRIAGTHHRHSSLFS
jgi:hypothetical protein